MLTEKSEQLMPGDPAALAIAVLMERVRSLPKEDRDDLYELSRELFSADTDEEWNSAVSAMLEILDQSPSKTIVLPCVETVDALSGWIEFVSDKIKTARKKAGLTQPELAKKSGIPQSHISRLENGKHSPSSTTLSKLADALGVQEKYFDPSA